MENNPFAMIVQSIREDGKRQIPAYHRIGTVKSVSPLIVEVSDTDQDEDSLLKNAMLTQFEKGDELLLMPMEEEQRYIILCKVVDA